eukprot:TRINITY_DN71866_c1_g1_i7.p1 TRINITY_DN71866_c1_g1~~TRINITY_DN71866_c1_g1_i7.p1  ORF type:complete len:291 (+),score=32.39 TRINITY_DN71866_c1_g1_i7:142-1014(+)
MEFTKLDWYQKPCMMGIDEAGRGPVLGPMVYAVAYCPIDFEQDLSKFGFADSKVLTEEQREQLFKKIKDENNIGYEVDIIHADVISAKMLSWEQVSLNVIANESTFGLINKVICRGVNLTKVFVDTVGDAELYQEILTRKFEGIEFKVKSKADAIYPIVSAASIVAKVTRDNSLDTYKFPEINLDLKRNWGCGYPSDPETQKWLIDNVDKFFGFPRIVRFSWQTTQTLMEQNCVALKFECEADIDEDPSQQKLNFKNSNQGIQRNKLGYSVVGNRHGFFKLRKMQRVQGL